MYELRQTVEFEAWLKGLRDRAGKARIELRLQRITKGVLGDVKSLGGGVSEIRVDFGPGYRLYFTRRGPVVLVLLAGGDKDTQTRDIETARRLAKRLGGEPDERGD